MGALRPLTTATPPAGTDRDLRAMDATTHPWRGQVLAVGTMHAKEQVLGPPVTASTGMRVCAADLDTDALGTFTGEVARPGTALETARRKADLAAADRAAPFGLGSEGSFGPHPEVPMVAVDLELVVLRSADGQVEVVESLLSTDTNHRHLDLTAPEIPASFLDDVAFPDHALVVAPIDGPGPLAKGIVDRATLDAAVARCLDTHGSARVLTDMRAHVNPSRQRVLAQLGARLADRLGARCPRCTTPGWGVVERVPGLPCEWCGGPTDLIATDVLACADATCGAREHQARAGHAPAGSCPECNP